MQGVSLQQQAAREQAQALGWPGRRSEHFRHLPPPALEYWLAPHDAGSTGDVAVSSGWTLDGGDIRGVSARHLNALDAHDRAELFAGLPTPAEDRAAPFAWAHRALCNSGLRLKVAASDAPVVLRLRRSAHGPVEAPLLVLEMEEGARGVLLETHERASDAPGVTQNLVVHVRLAANAHLQHLRVVAPGEQDRVAHHVHVALGAGARYEQALAATGSSYHLQRNTVELQGAGAEARNAALVLTAGQALDYQIHGNLAAPRTRHQVESLTLASGKARTVANVYARIAPGASEADVHQHLVGIAVQGNPHMTLRPHLEILHDNVRAVHGATWGALPEDALFYARQRGLDDETARTLIIEGMARAVFERCLGDTLEQPDAPLTQWFEGPWLPNAVARQWGANGEHMHG